MPRIVCSVLADKCFFLTKMTLLDVIVLPLSAFHGGLTYSDVALSGFLVVAFVGGDSRRQTREKRWIFWVTESRDLRGVGGKKWAVFG